jgi:glycosyltransferase involved in cell wall biosynthesis
MVVVHLTSSVFFGGPERQMLGLAQSLPASWSTVFLSFAENGRCREFLNEVRQRGFVGLQLEHDTPRWRAALRELTAQLRHLGAAVLCCHGYKANLLGRIAARRAGIPVVAVSRGWTGENWKVRLYEALDRFHLRWMDRVVCVSQGQAVKVRRAGVPPAKVVVIHNAIAGKRFGVPTPAARGQLQAYFPEPRRHIVVGAGRLSPEKGFAVLIAAAAAIVRADPLVGFLVFGDGVLRPALAQRITDAGLTQSFILAGFRSDLDTLLPSAELLVLPSYTEGLPNVVLEAFAAGVPVVATAVGGTPELVEEGVTGRLVPAGNVEQLTRCILETLASDSDRKAMAENGRQRVRQHFTFQRQSSQYVRLFQELCNATGARRPRRTRRLLPTTG